MTPRRLIEPARHAGIPLLRTQSDERLVDLTRDGNDRAFEAIVQRYRRPLLRYCERLLPATRAEDAVQQAFLSAYSAIKQGDAELRLRPWLYRIAHNAALNLLRQNGWNHEELSERLDGIESPYDAVARGERLRTVFAALKDLPERQRDALMLSAMEGRSYEEIAGELGVTGGAVRQLLNRARHTLRAGATAITPPGVLARLIESSDGSIAERVAQATAGAAGGGAVVKLAAGLVVAGAVVGGATQVAPSHHAHASSGHAGAVGRSSSAPGRDGSGSVAGSGLPEAVGFAPSRRSGPGRGAAGGGGALRRDGRGGHRSGTTTALTPVGEHGGRGPSSSSDGGGDRHSGSSDGSRSGSGSSGGSDGGGSSGSSGSRDGGLSGGSGGSDGTVTTSATTNESHDGGSTPSGSSDGGGSSDGSSTPATTTTSPPPSTDGRDGSPDGH